jgi:hypothetical protein
MAVGRSDATARLVLPLPASGGGGGSEAAAAAAAGEEEGGASVMELISPLSWAVVKRCVGLRWLSYVWRGWMDAIDQPMV